MAPPAPATTPLPSEECPSVSELSTFAVGCGSRPYQLMLVASRAEDLAHDCCPLLAVVSFSAPVLIPEKREDFLLAAREEKYNPEVPICKESVMFKWVRCFGGRDRMTVKQMLYGAHLSSLFPRQRGILLCLDPLTPQLKLKT